MTAADSNTSRSLRQRILRGAAGQVTGNLTRIVVQLAMAGVLLPAWGLQLYGEWLTVVGIALMLGASDFGFLSAAGSDMAIAVGRNDREHARDTFRTVGRGLGVAAALVLAGVLGFAVLAPLSQWLGFEQLDETEAMLILVMVAVQALSLMACLLVGAGYACVGDYGDAFAILAVVYLLEWTAAGIAALTGHGPLVATAALTGVRVVGMVAMYLQMRRRIAWLSLGRPSQKVFVRKRLTGPALAGAAIGWGTALSIQAMVVLVSVVGGAAAAATFATIRAVSRIVVQLAAAVGPTVGTEFARAFGSGDQALLRRLQRRVSQVGLWAAIIMVAVLAFVGDWLVALVTRGTVHVDGPILLILLAGAIFEVAWKGAGTILFTTNRHQRVGLIYTVASVAALGLAYVLVPRWGVDGAALSVLVLSVVMLAFTLRYSLRESGDSVGGWMKSVLNPQEIRLAVTAVRARRWVA